MNIDEYFDKLDDLEENVSSPEDLSKFLAYLTIGYRAGMWEQQDLVDYLGGIAGATEGIEGLCMNYGYEYPDQPTWAWFARILRIAFAHS